MDSQRASRTVSISTDCKSLFQQLRGSIAPAQGPLARSFEGFQSLVADRRVDNLVLLQGNGNPANTLTEVKRRKEFPQYLMASGKGPQQFPLEDKERTSPSENGNAFG